MTAIIGIIAKVFYIIIGIPLIRVFWKGIHEYSRGDDDAGAIVVVLMGIALPILYIWCWYSLIKMAFL